MLNIKNSFSKLMYFLVVLTFILPCQVDAKRKRKRRSKAKLKITVGTITPAGTPWADLLITARQRIKEKSKKEIAFKLYLGGLLGGEEEHIRQVIKGKINCAGISIAPFSKVVPAAFVLDMPFLFNDVNEVKHIHENFVVPRLKAIFKKHNLFLGGMTEVGWRGFGTVHKPIEKIETLKGMKISSYENPFYQKMWKSLGTISVPTAVTEVLQSLQTGLVSGVDIDSTYIVASAWYEGINFYTVTGHQYTSGAVVCNGKFVKSMKKEYFQIFNEVLMESVKTRKDKIREAEKTGLKMMEEAGKKVVVLDQKQKLAMKNAFKPVIKNLYDALGSDGQKLYNEVQKELERFRKKNK